MLDIYERNDFAEAAKRAQGAYQSAKQKMIDNLQSDKFYAVSGINDYNRVVEAQTKAQLLEELGVKAAKSIEKGESEDDFWKRLELTLVRMLSQGVDDSWSGRTNDVKRVAFSVKADIVRDLMTNFEKR